MRLADPFAYRALQVEDLVRRSAEFDLIHSHVEYLPWLAKDRLQAPLVTTLHGRLDLPELRPLLAAHRQQPLVSISDCQRRPVEDLDLNWVATVHHGLDLELSYDLGDGSGGYLAYLGRMAPEKDPVSSIKIAIKAGVPLKIAARVDSTEREYFEREVRPVLQHPLIEWVGEKDDWEKNRFLGAARAVLMPMDWDEPFGLTFIEALACGTPVISRPRGSLPEIVRQAVDGFLYGDDDDLVRACHDVLELDRAACRRRALEAFSSKRMVSDYERAYAVVTSGSLVAA
jgi:glycosyltransferase involved in cell wall biosynthesis